MRRREFIGLIGGAVTWPLAARTQQLNKVPRIGVLWNGKSAETHPYFQSLRNEFKRIGYPEGNLIFEDRFFNENFEIVDLLAKQLVDLKCDVLIGVTATAALALRRATSTIPIVFAFNSNPVGSGLVSSLNHPGGNVTGITHIGHEQAAKRLQLLIDTIPALSSVALIWDSTPTNLFQNRVEVEETRTAANQFGLSFEAFECDSPETIEQAISKASRFGAAILGNSSWYIFAREQIAELAIARRLAVIGSSDVFSDSGLLMSYGANWQRSWRGRHHW
jgi:ABC-type uncharacterized transport system substrate-binding protein